MVFYCVPALVVFLLTYDALLKDPTSPNDGVENWVFISIASLIWPLTLPCILRKKMMAWYATAKSKTSVA